MFLLSLMNYLLDVTEISEKNASLQTSWSQPDCMYSQWWANGK